MPRMSPIEAVIWFALGWITCLSYYYDMLKGISSLKFVLEFAMVAWAVLLVYAMIGLLVDAVIALLSDWLERRRK